MEQGHQGSESDVGSTPSRAVEALQREASELGREAKRASSQLLEQRVDKMFSLLDDVECAVRAAARELESEQHPRLAQYVNRAADEVAHARGRFGATDVNQLISSAESLARTRPLAVLGMAFAAGFAFVRLLKSSAPQTSGQSRNRGFEEDDFDRFDTAERARSYAGGGYGSQPYGEPTRARTQSYGSQSRSGQSGSQGFQGEFQGERSGSQRTSAGYQQQRDPAEGRDDE